jgi:hypothetical protein|nr:MAG TPA: hypothetical protein [Caudoviricetes sp.]
MRIVGRNTLVKSIRAIEGIMRDDNRCTLNAFTWLKPIAKLLGFNFENDGEFWRSIPYIFTDLYRAIPLRYRIDSPAALFKLWLEDQVLVVKYDDYQEYFANEDKLKEWESRYIKRYDARVFTPQFIFVVTDAEVKVFGQVDYDSVTHWWYRKAIELFDEYEDGVNNGVQKDIDLKLYKIMDYYACYRTDPSFKEFADKVFEYMEPYNKEFLPKHANLGRKFAELFNQAFDAYSGVGGRYISSPYDILLLWDRYKVIFAFADENGHISEKEYQRILDTKWDHNEMIFFICKNGSVRYQKTRAGLKGMIAKGLPPELDKKFHITEEVLIPNNDTTEVNSAKRNSQVLLMQLLDMKYERDFLVYLESLRRKAPNPSYFRAQQVASLIELTDATGDMVGIKFDRERLYYVYLEFLERNHKFYASDITVKINQLFKAGLFRIG